MSEKHRRFDNDPDLGYAQPLPSTGVPGKSTLSAKLFRRSSRDDNGVEAGAEEHVERASGSSGSALPGELRERFETSLGADLSGVRVHTGPESEGAAAAVSARAYTVGNDIHFGAGQYDPSSSEGLFLIAHEVAHTVQQAGSTPTRQNKLEVSAPGDAAEIEADQAAAALVEGAPFSLSAGPSALSRDKEEKPADDKATKADVTNQWKVDFHPMPRADGVPKTARPTRTGKESFTGSLKIDPDGGDAQVLNGTNAAGSGAVKWGSTTQADGSTGKASISGKFGGKGGLSVKVGFAKSVSAKDKAAHAADLTAVQAKAAAALDKALQTDGTEEAIRAAIQNVLPPEQDGVKFEITSLSLSPKAGSGDISIATDAVSYGAVKDKQTLTAKIDVPYQTFTKSTQKKANGEKQEGAEKKEAESSSQETVEEKENARKEAYAKSSKQVVATALKNAWSHVKNTLDETTKTHTESSELAVSGSGEGEVKIDLQLPGLGKILDFIPKAGRFKKFLKVMPSIELKDTKVKGSVTGSWGSKESDTTVDTDKVTTEDIVKFDNEVTTHMETTEASNVETHVRTALKITKKNEESKDEKNWNSTKSGWESAEVGSDLTFELLPPTLVIA